ncbi:MAG: DUF4192 domain-containing protein [Cumulibacter sp.]
MTAFEPDELADYDPHEIPQLFDSEPVAVRGLTELRASIPYLLGFYPERSLVAIGLHRDGAVVMTVRIDAPCTVAQARSVVAHLVEVTRRGTPHRLVLAYCDEYEQSADPDEHAAVHSSALRAYETVRDLEPILCAEFSTCGVPVEFVWPDRPGMPRAEGGPTPAIAVAHVMSGRRLLRNRGEVAARLEPAAGDARARTHRHTGALQLVPHSRIELVAMVTDILERHATAREDGYSPAALDPYDAAVCALAMRDVSVRDIVITLVAQELAWRHEDLWCRVSQLVPTGYIAPVATMAGVCAYLGGDGALAGCAFDVALRHEPEYSLAQMIDASLRAGLPPQQLRSILASTFDPDPSSEREADGAD